LYQSAWWSLQSMADFEITTLAPYRLRLKVGRRE
jgi:hypothetical protein